MPVHNSEVAAIFRQVADLLAIEGANPFRVRAYRNAARTVEELSSDLAVMVASGEDLSRLPDIGHDLAGKIAEIVETGQLKLLDDLRGEVPEAVAQITGVPGVGPKRARALMEALGVASMDDLRKAAEDGRIADVPGFGEKLQARILREIEEGRITERRFRIDRAEEFAESILDFIRGIEGVKEALVAGSYRRRKETVGDLDILVTAKKGAKVMKAALDYDEIARVASQGPTRATVLLRSGLQVDIRVVREESYGAALMYFTGSKAHNIVLRRRAQAKGLKLNEYGLFRGKKRVAGKTEEEVYKALGLPWIVPELREDRGELAAAERGKLPDLVSLEDMKGDLHVHTTASDGTATIEEMAEAAKALGYEYLAIADHSPSQRIANGLSVERLAEHLDAIDAVNDRLKGIRLLKASEVDILEDGSLDYPDKVLARLDLVVAAVHSQFTLPEEKQTARILKALDNPHVGILAHPTGRLIGERGAYSVNLEKVFEAATERGVALEINAHPMRLDLDDLEARIARDMGAQIAISTDAHSTGGLDYMSYGVAQARRGWLTREDVLNTRGLDAMLGLLRKR
ncbi:DNA polymerase/3'-5' exonuclease PolX [Ostreiculturibacter nitratireducens]|uniref:DNA polymerase/3'-5' exonuclease PolX n=1 Tax=Ostreiculturibacter nitratireducens TaxID=3075226 RepID=UPI0031B5C022